MDTHRSSKHPLFFLSLFLAFSFLVDATRSFAQVQPRVVESVDKARRVTLTGNVHPLAREEFDRGATDDGMLTQLPRFSGSEALFSITYDFFRHYVR
jgi:hypothetical protein